MSERDVQVRIQYGDLTVLINEEGVSHSPDVLDDLVTRALATFKESWAFVSADDEPAADDVDG